MPHEGPEAPTRKRHREDNGTQTEEVVGSSPIPGEEWVSRNPFTGSQ